MQAPDTPDFMLFTGNANPALASEVAGNLGISVVAEGVETVDQAMVLQSLECEYGQGYLFSPPLQPTEVAEFKVQPGILPGQAVCETAGYGGGL